jgi:hypothetical protein
MSDNRAGDLSIDLRRSVVLPDSKIVQKNKKSQRSTAKIRNISGTILDLDVDLDPDLDVVAGLDHFMPGTYSRPS